MECSSAAWKGGGENHYYILRAVFDQFMLTNQTDLNFCDQLCLLSV